MDLYNSCTAQFQYGDVRGKTPKKMHEECHPTRTPETDGSRLAFCRESLAQKGSDCIESEME
jgi:hypothetical protein